MKIGHKVPPHGGNGKLPGGIPIMRLHHKDGLNTDRTVKPVYSVNQLFICGMNESQQEFGAQFIVITSVTVNGVYCHRRVKNTSPVTENHNKNGYATLG